MRPMMRSLDNFSPKKIQVIDVDAVVAGSKAEKEPTSPGSEATERAAELLAAGAPCGTCTGIYELGEAFPVCFDV